MSTKLDPRDFDVRTLDHRLRRGEISPEDLQAFLASLPDEGGEAVETHTRFEAPFADRVRAADAARGDTEDDDDDE